jgi:hypothetical protein
MPMKPKLPQFKMRLPVFKMQFQTLAIEHLGLRLYSTLPPVINEFVTNAYDAEAPKVEVFVPTGPLSAKSEVIVRDYGLGLTPDEVQSEFLPIGRNRRGVDSTNVKSKNGKRNVTGRKGLGKLSALGVAEEVEVRAVKDGFAVALRMRFSEMRAWAEKHPEEPYEPTVVTERTGDTDDPNGLEVTLRHLRRTSPVDPTAIRRGLARRLRIVGLDFVVLVNGKQIGSGDRVSEGQCVKAWKFADTPAGEELANGDKVSGWIGFLEGSSQADRGVDIFANGKAVELGSFFNYATPHAQFARAYVVGEVHAPFLDAPTGDLVSTARNSVVWESQPGHDLQEWGQGLLRWAFDEWVKFRVAKREDEVFRAGRFDEWLETREPREQKVARRLVKLLADSDDIEPTAVNSLLEIVKSSVETIAFRELVDEMEERGATVKTLLKLFEEWRVIEAREHLQLADGRISAIEQLMKFMDEGALEVSELQPLLEGNLWLLDGGWSDAWIQPTYTKMLREYCDEPRHFEDKDRRLDIVGIQDSGRVTVVELKRPEKTLSREDLNQIERYRDWAGVQFAGQVVEGLLLVGKMSKDATLMPMIPRLAGAGIRVQTYNEIHARAGEYFRQIEKQLTSTAPEYARSRRRARKGPAKSSAA